MGGDPPVLVEPKLREPGFARASASSSNSVFAGISGVTVMTFGVLATTVTGAKSVIGSPRCTWTVLHHHGLFEPLSRFLSNRSRDYVRGAAGRERDDQANRLVRPAGCLRLCSRARN
jgi:hypothetical protein